MLKTLRRNTKLIIWIVVLSFALWGAFSISTQFQKKDRYAGVIFGKPVSHQRFNQFYEATRIFTPGGQPIQDPELLRQRTWQNLIYAHVAKERGIKVTDDEVRQEVRRILSQQGIENPTPQIYQNWLRSTVGDTPRRFEEKVREFLRISKLIHQVLSQPIELPRGEKLQQQFLLDQVKITAEAVMFSERDQALAFVDKARGATGWAAAAQAAGKDVTPIQEVTLRELFYGWQIPQTALATFQQAKENDILGPFPAAKQQAFWVLRILSKQEPDPSKKEEWKENFKNRLVYQRFVNWSEALYQEANLKDYLPKPTPPPPPPSERPEKNPPNS